MLSTKKSNKDSDLRPSPFKNLNTISQYQSPTHPALLNELLCDRPGVVCIQGASKLLQVAQVILHVRYKDIRIRDVTSCGLVVYRRSRGNLSIVRIKQLAKQPGSTTSRFRCEWKTWL
jgi:hypothetical protein